MPWRALACPGVCRRNCAVSGKQMRESFYQNAARADFHLGSRAVRETRASRDNTPLNECSQRAAGSSSHCRSLTCRLLDLSPFAWRPFVNYLQRQCREESLRLLTRKRLTSALPWQPYRIIANSLHSPYFCTVCKYFATDWQMEYTSQGTAKKMIKSTISESE